LQQHARGEQERREPGHLEAERSAERGRDGLRDRDPFTISRAQ
jgi:hypothetical protein